MVTFSITELWTHDVTTFIYKFLPEKLEKILMNVRICVAYSLKGCLSAKKVQIARPRPTETLFSLSAESCSPSSHYLLLHLSLFTQTSFSITNTTKYTNFKIAIFLSSMPCEWKWKNHSLELDTTVLWIVYVLFRSTLQGKSHVALYSKKCMFKWQQPVSILQDTSGLSFFPRGTS